MKPLCHCLTLVALAATAARAADVQSGPAAGDKAAAFKVFDATGKHRDKDVDYTADRADKPTLFVFINEWNRPTARFLKKLDEAVRNDAPAAYQVGVWLTDDADKLKEHLPRVQQSLQLENTAMTVFTGEKKGPEGWGLNDMAHVTAVVVGKGGKVVKSFAFVSVNETDADAVQKVLKEAAEK